jgi:hypothetical protein
MRHDVKVYALSAMALAGLGIAVSMLGEHLGRPFLQHKLGPAITLGGAGLWVYGRFWRRRGRR